MIAILTEEIKSRIINVLRETIDEEVTRWYLVAENPKTEMEDVELAEGRALYLAELEALLCNEITQALVSCKVPPPGWCCTREPNHDGPCAAWPVST